MQSEKRQNPDRIDSLFRIALVLLGIISSAVFQFNQQFGTTTTFSYSIRVTTLPFMILIIIWIMKELLKEWLSFNKIMALTEFCWDFWDITFFYYAISFINFQNPNQPVNTLQAGLLLLPFIGLILIVYFTYRKIYGADKEYFKKPTWILFSILLFILTYVILVLLVFPFEFL